jgi:hypothetical protein
MGEGQRAAGIQDAAAVGRAAVRDREAVDLDAGPTAADVEDAAGIVASDGRLVGAQSFDAQAPGDGQLALERDNLAGEMVVEPDRIAGVGDGDLRAQRSAAAVGGAGDRQYAENSTVFQYFDLWRDPERAHALRAPAGARAARCLPPHCLQPCAEKERHDWCSLKQAACGIMEAATCPGAQTERRGGAGPVGACLAVRASPAAFRSSLVR